MTESLKNGLDFSNWKNSGGWGYLESHRLKELSKGEVRTLRLHSGLSQAEAEPRHPGDTQHSQCWFVKAEWVPSDTLATNLKSLDLAPPSTEALGGVWRGSARSHELWMRPGEAESGWGRRSPKGKRSAASFPTGRSPLAPLPPSLQHPHSHPQEVRH